MMLITAARLVAIPKPSGGLRPIAVGETFRRLAAKLLKAVKDSLKECLTPEQIGVAVPNAAETAARQARLWLQQAGDRDVMLQVDMKNAFGSVERDDTPLLKPFAYLQRYANEQRLTNAPPADQ